jgi:hypothetical protein
MAGLQQRRSHACPLNISLKCLAGVVGDIGLNYLLCMLDAEEEIHSTEG